MNSQAATTSGGALAFQSAPVAAATCLALMASVALLAFAVGGAQTVSTPANTAPRKPPPHPADAAKPREFFLRR